MTYGHWIAQARTHLACAAQELSTGPGPATAVNLLSMASSRHNLYRQLRRHVELLTGDPTAFPHATRHPARQHVDSSARLAAALRAALGGAAGAPDTLPPAAPTTPACRSLDAAAQCLAVAGDILATHLGGSRQRPRTAEGVAIRAGGGVSSALAELARVALDTIAVDLVLPGWLKAAGAQHRTIGAPVADAAHQAATGALPAILGDLIAAGRAGPSLLHGLDAAPTPGQAEADVRTVEDAVASLRAVRTWLWQNLGQHHAIHLRLGTQLGLAVTILAAADPTDHTSSTRAWRRAAAAAAQIEGSTPVGEAGQVADTQAAVLAWTRTALHGAEPPPVGELAAQLPALAETLFDGVPRAVERGEIFVNQTALSGTPRGLIVHAAAVWRRASIGDATIRELRNALGTARDARGGEDTPTRPSRVRSAFQRPPRLNSAQPPPQPSPPSVQVAQRRSR
jgi:hypothetical protein